MPELIQRCRRSKSSEFRYTFALIYIGLGDKEEALNWLEKQMLGRSETANAYAVAPELDVLRSDPRFKEMLKRMNLPE